MPIQSIPIGTPTTLLANVVYALPPVTVSIFTAAAGITQSNTPDFLASTVVPTGVSIVGGGFIKAPIDIPVTLKRER